MTVPNSSPLTKQEPRHGSARAPSLCDEITSAPTGTHRHQHAFVKLVNAMPSIAGMDGCRRGMGAASAFRFGAMFGAIKATLSCTRVAFTLVAPTTWKRFYGLIRADKEQSTLRALQLHPELAAKLARRKDVGCAEALLIARFRECALLALPRAHEAGGAS
jgi:hypothetical protein